jgi:hypothetical protein
MNNMKKRKNQNEQPKQRFSKELYGDIIRRLFRLMPTAKLARLLGLEPRKVSDYIYRNNEKEWAGKDAAERSQVASENGKKGGRPRKKS